MMEARIDLTNVLSALLNEDQKTREMGESKLHDLARMPGYAVELSKILVNESISLDLRQLAGIILKRFIKHQWEPPLSNTATHIKVPEADRETLKQILPQALQFPQYKLRMAAAMCIASIAHWDWPKKWPGLIQSLLDCLASPNLYLVEGAICCLETIASGENSSDQQLPGLITLLFPPLYQIVSDNHKYDARIKMRSVSVVTSCLEWLSVTKQVSSAPTETIAAVLPQWLQAFHHHLSTSILPTDFFGLKTAILGTLLVLIHHFSSLVKNDMDKILAPIWMSLVGLLKVYEERAVLSDTLREVEGLREGESGDSYGLGPYVSLALEVFHGMASKSRFRNLLKPHLSDLFYLVMGFLQVTEEQIEMYETDPNQWVADEDDDTLEFNVRISSGKLIQELVHGFKQEAIQPFSEAISKRLLESTEGLKNNNPMWWKLRECIMYSVGLVSTELMEKNGNVDFLKGFYNSVLLSDVKNPLPFLRGRALWCASTFVKVLSPEEITPFLVVASSTLNNPADPIPTKIFACRAIGNFCPRLQSAIAGPYLDGIMGGLVAIIEKLSKEALYLLLETFHALLPLSEEVASRHLIPIVTALLLLWAHNYKDGLLISSMLDILSDFAHFPSSNLLLQEKLVPTLVNFLRQPHNHQPIIIETAIDMSATLLMPVKGTLCPTFLDQFFPLLCDLMMKTTESGLLDSGITSLRAFVRNGGPLLLNWKYPSFSGESGLEVIIKIISRLLSPGIPDNTAMNTGFLIDKVLTVFPQQIGPILDQILSTVLVRLHSSSDDSSLHQGLLTVFIRLFHMDPLQSIAFLLSKGNGGTSELSFILSEWTRQHSDFRGAYKIKLSIVALCKLFQCNHPALNNLLVKGDIEVPSTRTKKANQKPNYPEEPLRFTIFKTLIREYQVILENLSAKNFSLSDSEEDEWDDIDDEELVHTKQLEDGTEEHISTLIDDPFVEFGFFDEEFEGHFQNEEKDDPDIKEDPIYTIDLKDYLCSFLKAFSEQDNTSFLSLAKNLPSMEKKCLNLIFQK